MPCESMRKRNQTLSQRVAEVSKIVERVNQMVASGRIQVKVGSQGAIVFVGIPEEIRDGVTDACIYRRMMVSGSALARMKIAQAEQLSGRSVDRRSVAQGWH